MSLLSGYHSEDPIKADPSFVWMFDKPVNVELAGGGTGKPEQAVEGGGTSPSFCL